MNRFYLLLTTNNISVEITFCILNKNLSNNLEFDKYVKYTKVGLLNKDSNQVGSLELGIKSELSLINNFNLQKCKVLYLLGVDNYTYNKYKTLLSINPK